MVAEPAVESKVIAPYALNSYVWAALKANLNMSEADYGKRMPIIPSGQMPEFTAYDKPFVVYGFSEDSTPDLFEMRSGSLSYAVWSKSVGEVNDILNTIRGVMERHDESAREINAYTDRIPTFAGIRFRDIHIGYFEGPSPEESEGGRKAGIITIRYQYAMTIKVKRFNPYTGEWS